MNVWKKVSMLTFVVALAMSFCVMAGAVTKDVGDNANTTAELENTYTGFDAISFAVTLTNSTAGQARPEIAFTYAITPPSGTVPTLSFNGADANGKKTVTFALTNDGTNANDTVTVDVTDVSGVVSDVYNYTITQEAVDNGVATFAAVTKTLKIAVNAGKVTQAVLVDSDETTKVAGFNNTYTRPKSGVGTIGNDVLIMKTVIGPAANTTLDESNAFDITINLPTAANGHWNGLDITLVAGAKGLGFNSNQTTVTLTGGSATLSGTIYAIVTPETSSYTTGTENANALTISGLPEGSTVMVTDKISDGQKLKAYHNSTGSYAQSVGESNNYVTTASGAGYSTTATSGTAQVKIEYVGLREAISLTGVTLRYAPYLLTLGAGITVLPLTRSYKKREED